MTATNLPVQLTSFIGRERELAEVGELISNSCLVTLTGAGHMSENIGYISQAGQNSLGCFILLMIAGIGLLGLGYLLQTTSALVG